MSILFLFKNQLNHLPNHSSNHHVPTDAQAFSQNLLLEFIFSIEGSSNVLLYIKGRGHFSDTTQGFSLHMPPFKTRSAFQLEVFDLVSWGAGGAGIKASKFGREGSSGQAARIPPTKDWLRQGGFIHSVTTTIPIQRKRRAGAGQKGSFTSSAGLNLRLRAPTVLLDPPAESRMTPKDGFKPPPTASVLQSAQSLATGKPRGSGRGAYGGGRKPLAHSPLRCLLSQSSRRR